MTDRKKTTGRSRTATVGTTSTPRSSRTGKTEKAAKASADETMSTSQTEKAAKTSTDETTSTSQSVKASKTEKAVKTSTDETTPTSRSVKADKTEKAVKTSARERRRREPAKQIARRDAKGSTGFAKRLRSNRIGRFLYEAYYELRYKVTWPTFREARNMTAVVIALSSVIGLLLWGADIGLHWLFLFIITPPK